MANLLNMSGGSLLNKVSLLPSGYRQVEYVENSNGGYINTGFLAVGGMLHEGLGMCINVEGAQNAMWGSIGPGYTEDTTRNNLSIFLSNNLPVISGQKMNTLKFFDIPNLIDSYHFIHDTRGTNNKLIVNGVLKENVYVGRLTNPINTVKIGWSDFSNATRYCRTYWYKITDANDVLVRDYIPCVDANNVAGLYDIANSKFYKSAIGTPLVAGPEV